MSSASHEENNGVFARRRDVIVVHLHQSILWNGKALVRRRRRHHERNGSSHRSGGSPHFHAKPIFRAYLKMGEYKEITPDAAACVHRRKEVMKM